MRKFREGLAVIFLIFGGLLVFGLWEKSTGAAIAVGVVAFLLIGLVSPSSSCDLCDAEIKKKSFKWKIDGETQHVCPSCNSALSRKRSNKAVSNVNF